MKYIVSGLPPGSSGVGRVMEYLIENLSDIKIIHPLKKSALSLRYSLKKKRFIEALTIVVSRLFDAVRFPLLLSGIKNEKLIVIHPQRLGIKIVERLINKNKVSFYLMDNGFFCVKSYNHIPGENGACVRCLGGAFSNALKMNCHPYPVRYNIDKNLRFLNILEREAENIFFYTQNEEQINLLKAHFGKEVKYKKIGLLTSDMFEVEKVRIRPTEKFDIIFHGADLEAKGVGYTLQLARKLPGYSFLFPFIKNESDGLANVFYRDVTWQSGLREYIENAQLTICPSCWSAPIEGSVVKTLQLGVPCALLNTVYAFAKEVPADFSLKLTGDIDKDTSSILAFFRGEKNVDYVGARDWAWGFVEQMKIDFNEEFKCL